MSSYGVMRGLHFQRPPFTQSKLVRCVKGRVIIIPSFLTLKEGSTFLTKPLFNGLYTPFGSPVSGGQKPQGREDVTALQCCICPTCPSPAGGSLTHSQALALSKRARDVTALLGARNRYALRLADHQRSSPYFAGWDRMGNSS